MHQNELTEAVCLIFPKENMNRKKQRQSKVGGGVCLWRAVGGGGGMREALAQELCDLTTRTKTKKGNLSHCTLNYKAEVTEWCTSPPLMWTTTDVYDLALIPAML